MILVDTSIWVDHLRSGNPLLISMLERGQVLAHPSVVGELALGHLRQRTSLLDGLLRLPQATVASDTEALHFIDRHRLFGRGIGYVDAHLLAAIQLTPDARFWTTDKRLHDVANALGLALVA
jgi:predicted nucleic acid-binding protein